MYAVCGKKVAPPFNQVEHDAATACGRLPLVLNIAGGLLKQAGGVINRAFVDMLSEDHGEVLREGEFGDLHVSLEDRLVGKSLEHYQGAYRDGVLKLFSFFAAFPEDVPVPASVFEMFATSLLGAVGKRPQLQVRDWSAVAPRAPLLVAPRAPLLPAPGALPSCPPGPFAVAPLGTSWRPSRPPPREETRHLFSCRRV